VQVWRLASAVDSLKFKFVPDQVYYFQAGHRYWAKGATAAATQVGNSEYLSFKFDGATSTILGYAALATSIVVSMF
jgi:hypothetical protein